MFVYCIFCWLVAAGYLLADYSDHYDMTGSRPDKEAIFVGVLIWTFSPILAPLFIGFSIYDNHG